MRFFVLCGIVLSTSAFANVAVTEVYKVVGVTQRANAEWTDLKTVTGLTIYVRCSTSQFDDSEHDRVGGFRSTKDCEEFLATIRKNASAANPAEVTIGGSTGMSLKISL